MELAERTRRGDWRLLDAGRPDPQLSCGGGPGPPGASGGRRTPGSLKAGDTVVIRSHGELKVRAGRPGTRRGIRCVNATCPNVCRIQRLVAPGGGGGPSSGDHRRAAPSGGDGRGQLVPRSPGVRRAEAVEAWLAEDEKKPGNPLSPQWLRPPASVNFLKLLGKS